jgi:predicted transcriptional regulator
VKRKTDIAKIIAANTKAYRAGLGITQFELAEGTGISLTLLDVAEAQPPLVVSHIK